MFLLCLVLYFYFLMPNMVSDGDSWKAANEIYLLDSNCGALGSTNPPKHQALVLLGAVQMKS